MNELQEKAIDVARTVLFNKFKYNANKLALMDMYNKTYNECVKDNDFMQLP